MLPAGRSSALCVPLRPLRLILPRIGTFTSLAWRTRDVIPAPPENM